ncbi:FecR family protein [Spirosoma fluminis]
MNLPPEPFSTVHDFLEDATFQRWVRERRPDDAVFWQHWLDQHPEKRDLYEQAVATLLVLQGKRVDVSNQQLKEKRKEILNQLNLPFTVVKPIWLWGRWAAAAAVVSIIVLWQAGKFDFSPLTDRTKPNKSPQNEVVWKLVKNVTEQPLVVLLPDNSSVLLSAGSQLRYLKQSPNRLREVYLRGEGFFEVAKNPAKPFVVYTTNLTTKVLGTSFQVRAFDREPASYVKVKAGKVSVTPVDSPGRLILLTKNEQLSLETSTDKVVKGRIHPSKENPTAPVNQSFQFEFSPVPDVLAQLESSYHMPIQFDRQLLKNCTFTGQLNDVPFLEKIRLICITIESTFDVVDNHVVIHSHGCS